MVITSRALFISSGLPGGVRVVAGKAEEKSIDDGDNAVQALSRRRAAASTRG